MTAPSVLHRLLLGLLLVAPWACLAQSGTPPPQAALWIPPTPGLQPVRLDRVDIDIRSDGFLARTRIELTFVNPNARVLEGEFVFPLAGGQTVSGYELDVNGQMRAGVVVPKETARVAFEDTIRQQIDPGLAELTRGNVFRTRLYPIPANGSKRIALSFEQAMDDDGTHYRYLLPLAFKQTVGHFSVRAQAQRVSGKPTDASASPDAALSFDRAGDSWSATLERENVTPQRELAFRIPKAGDESNVLEAADALDPAWRSVVALLDSGLPKRDAAVATKHVALWIDASGSARERDRTRERGVLQQWLKKLGNVDVDLVAFRNVADAPQRFRIERGDATALLAAIDALPLDGGSSYGAIDPGLTPDADLVLVVGDGLSNFGVNEPAFVAGAGTPLIHTLSAAQRADHARLARIARRGGGQALDLLRADSDAAVAALLARPWQLRALRSDGGECVDLAPRAPLAVGARVTLTARCRGRGTVIAEFGSGERRVERRIAFGARAVVPLALEDAVHRLWAAAHLTELDAQATPDRAQMIALATRYAVVTRDTSLLVLDRIEDYVRYRVEPKEDDLRAQYRALLASTPKVAQLDASLPQRIEALAAQWKQFREWHDTRHAWLETLLAPTAAAESALWTRVAAGDAKASAAAKRANALRERSDALVARWRAEGADDSSRANWEREATTLMLQIDALRRERLTLAPESAGWTAVVGQEEGDVLESIEVTGSRIMHATAETAQPVVQMDMASPAPPPAAVAAGALARERNAADGAPEQKMAAQAAPPVTARIELAGWNPDTPYLKALRAARDPYAAYLRERETHGTAPAFFLDCADYFRDEARQPALGLRVLSNIAELGLEEVALVRVLGYRLAQWNEYALAVGQFEEALLQRPEEPQSYRDLALALARRPQPDVARAVALLWKVASGDWHGRFPGIEVIALHELNDVLAAAPGGSDPKLATLKIPAELLDPIAVGLRVVMTWDADNTDIDLWVTDPVGERAYYGQPRTRSGGHVSNDFTQGYGPEVYTIRRPLPGTYRVQAHYFGDRRQSLTGPVTVQLEFQTRFGSAGGERASVTRRLESGKEDIEIGTFIVQ